MNKLKKLKQDNGKLCTDHFRGILASFSEDTNRFPDDAEFKLAFQDKQLSNQNAREILFCIALYHNNTGLADIRKLSASSYSVEHIMPVKWRNNWMIPDIDENGQALRDRSLKTLGNLTLVTGRLNSKLSNLAWGKKKDILKKHSSLRMTIDYLENDNWDEKNISRRAEDLVKSAMKMWSHYK